LILFTHVSSAEELQIERFETGGQLTFTEVEGAERYWVEWAPTMDGPWTNFTGETTMLLDDIPITGEGSITVTVPMFYRVRADVPPAPTVFEVRSSGSSAYLINDQTNPTLDLIRGQTYIFSLNVTGHPFWIKTAATTGPNNPYNDGLSTNGIPVGQIEFIVPTNAPDTLFYICQFHGAMQGTINITGGN
jgi:hypothetical protein